MNWVDTLKQGDQVWWDYSSRLSLETIEDVTPDFIIINGESFSKKTLKSAGYNLEKATPERLEQCRLNIIKRNKASRFNEMDLTLEQKAACYDFLKGLKEKVS
jgi:hypothetical protein